MTQGAVVAAVLLGLGSPPAAADTATIAAAAETAPHTNVVTPQPHTTPTAEPQPGIPSTPPESAPAPATVTQPPGLSDYLPVDHLWLFFMAALITFLGTRPGTQDAIKALLKIGGGPGNPPV